MKTTTIKWIDLIDCMAKVTLWSILLSNLFVEKYDVSMVYAVIIMAYGIGEIAYNTKVKKDE